VKCADVTARSDLFSVGVVMYEMLTGVKPFTAPDVSGILRNVVEKEPPLASEVNPEVPETAARIVARLLPKSPDDRFQNAHEALREVQALRGSTPTPTPPPEILPIEAAEPEKGNETTDTNFNDRTPAIASGTRNVLPPALSYSIIGILAAGLIGAIAIIHAQTDGTPTGVMTPQQRAQFVAKKNALSYAYRLLADGRYDESVQAYDDLLKIYPKSIMAQAGRNEAMKQADAHKAKSTVTTQASKPDTKKPDQKPGFWQRIFKRGKPPK
jgi:serine/threonine protein kinase